MGNACISSGQPPPASSSSTMYGRSGRHRLAKVLPERDPETLASSGSSSSSAVATTTTTVGNQEKLMQSKNPRSGAKPFPKPRIPPTVRRCETGPNGLRIRLLHDRNPSSSAGRPLSAILRDEQQQQNAAGAGGGHHLWLSIRDREIIARCWRRHIASKRTDLFHRCMLQCIEASPKLNEIIACGRYCYRDLRKWPKLNRICQAQFKFHERLIYELNLDEQRVLEACSRLGQTHADYARYGMKPHFLDIYRQQLLSLISRLDYDDAVEREQCILAFCRFSSFIIDVFIDAYGKRVTELREEQVRKGLPWQQQKTLMQVRWST